LVQDEHASEADEAFLAAAQVMRNAVFEVTRIDGRKRLTSALLCFVTRDTVVLETEHNVIEDRGRDELCIGVLEDETDFLARVCLVVFGNRCAVDDEFAVVGNERRVQVFKKCRLPSTVATDERDHFVGVHREVDIVHPDCPVGVSMGLTPEVDEWSIVSAHSPTP
jgi:hypothetical protein